MKYEIIITNTAKDDLRKIALYIASVTSDVSIASRFISALRSECEKLETMPEIGALPKDRVLLSRGYRFLVYNDYLIFYLIDDQQFKVNVMAVFHSRRDYFQVMQRFL